METAGNTVNEIAPVAALLRLLAGIRRGPPGLVVLT
jgi:hypothetical protein